MLSSKMDPSPLLTRSHPDSRTIKQVFTHQRYAIILLKMLTMLSSQLDLDIKMAWTIGLLRTLGELPGETMVSSRSREV